MAGSCRWRPAIINDYDDDHDDDDDVDDDEDSDLNISTISQCARTRFWRFSKQVHYID